MSDRNLKQLILHARKIKQLLQDAQDENTILLLFSKLVVSQIGTLRQVSETTSLI